MASKKCDGLYKRGRIYWASRDPLTGDKGVSTKCTDVEAARMWLRERERLRANPAYLASRQATFGDWATKFLAGKVAKSEATLAFNTSKVKAILTVFPRDLPLSAVDAGAIDDYVVARLNSKGRRPPKAYTVTREVRTITAILAKAKRKGCYAGDLESLTPDLDGHYTPRERSLTPEEVVAFVGALPNNHWKALAAVCVALGCRLSEACRITREDVELDSGLVWIDGRKTSTSNRTLPILSPYRSLLESALPHLPIGVISNVDRTFKLAAERAGIPNLSPNDLRRTHATLNSVMGLPDDLIAKLLGHATVSMTKRVYNRARAVQLAPVAERLLEQGKPVEFGKLGFNPTTVVSKKGRKSRE
jgi:integrase